MKATVVTVIDGQVYNIGDDLPDFGSLTCTDVHGKIRIYEGKNEDASKLPKYDNLSTGSSASLVGADGSLHVYKYVAQDKTWIEIK